MDNIPTRQNNPGDIKVRGKIARYNSPNEGKAALYNDLTAKMTGTSTTGIGPGSSLVDFAKVYAPDSDGNNSLQYAANLANKMGVSPDTKIGTLTSRIDDFANAVSSNEGYQGPSSGASTPGTQPNKFPSTQLQIPDGMSTNEASSNESPTQKVVGLAKGAVNFLAPSIGDAYHLFKGDNQKTPLQLAGDLGSTALSVGTIVPGLGEGTLAAKLGLAGEEAANVATKTTPGLLETVGKNAALGTGFGASNALGEGKTDAKDIAEQGIVGGITGGLLGGAGKLGEDYLAKKASVTAGSRLEEQTNRLKTLSKAFEANSTKTTNPIQTITTHLDESTNKPIVDGLRVNGNKVDASALTNPQNTGTLDNLIEDHSSKASELVKGMTGRIPTDEYEENVLRDIANNPEIRDAGGVSKAQTEARRIFADYRESFGDTMDYSTVDNIRARMNRVYDPAERDVARTIGDGARNYLYNGDGTNTALRTLMQNEAELIKAKNFVEKLHGTTVPGGQLGKYVADLGGTMVGSAAGGALGPLGNIGGAVIGGATTHGLMNAVQRNYFNPIDSRVAGFLNSGLRSKAGKVIAGTAKAGLLKGASQ